MVSPPSHARINTPNFCKRSNGAVPGLTRHRSGTGCNETDTYSGISTIIYQGESVTIELRGGRGVRGVNRTKWMIGFVVGFIHLLLVEVSLGR